MSTKSALKRQYGRLQNVTDYEYSGILVKSGLFVVLSLFSIMMITPLLIFFMNSLKGETGIFIKSYELPTDPTLSNYITAFTEGGFLTYLINSSIVVAISLVLIVITSLFAAYALTRFDFKYKYIVTSLILAGFMMPPQILIIPRFVMLSRMELIDTHLSLILVYVASALPFGVFLLRQYMMNIPETLANAAMLDGCSEFQIMTRVYAPLTIPAISAVTVFEFVILWNEFIYSITFINTDSMRTIPAGLMQFKGAWATEWPSLMAGIGIAVFPVLLFFVLFRDQFVRSISMRAKG